MSNQKLVTIIKNIQGRLSQNEFAKRCGISSSNLTRIYKDLQKPSPDLLKKIAEYTGSDFLYSDLMIAADYWNPSEKFLSRVDPCIFSCRLKTLRKEFDTSIENLHDRTGIDVEKLNGFEEQLVTPDSFGELVSIARVFGVYSNYLSGEVSYKNEAEHTAIVQSSNTVSKSIDAINLPSMPTFTISINELLKTILEYQFSEERAYLDEYIDLLSRLFKSLDEFAFGILMYKNMRDNEVAHLGKDFEKLEHMADYGTVRAHDNNHLNAFYIADNLRKDLGKLLDEVFKDTYPDIEKEFYGSGDTDG